MCQDSAKVSCDDLAFHFDCVNEGKRICDFFECTADKIKVEPDAREPSGEVCEQCAADAADLLIIENTAEQKSEGNEQK